jgi:hypothetical protein
MNGFAHHLGNGDFLSTNATVPTQPYVIQSAKPSIKATEPTAASCQSSARTEEPSKHPLHPQLDPSATQDTLSTPHPHKTTCCLTSAATPELLLHPQALLIIIIDLENHLNGNRISCNTRP